MKNKLNFNIKIDKTKTSLITNLAIASFLLAFGIFASKKLLSVYVYQTRVISAQKTSIANIYNDQQVASNVVNAYKQFVNQKINIIGGTSIGSSSTSGNNAKIILDALPQSYDFPAILSSVQKLLTTPGIAINSITGTDNAVIVPQSNQPTPVPISFSVSGSYTQIQGLLGVLNRSILPIDVLNIQLSGSDNYLTATISAQTYYFNPPSGIITSIQEIQ